MRAAALSIVGIVVFMTIAFVYSIGKEAPAQIGTYPDGRTISVENYVRAYISDLSPVKETLGGKFHVTDISISDGYGAVAYEDGHMAYIADFTYKIHSDAGIEITKFVVR